MKATDLHPQGIDEAARLPAVEDVLEVKIGHGSRDYTKDLPLGCVPRGLRGGVGGAGRVYGHTRGPGRR